MNTHQIEVRLDRSPRQPERYRSQPVEPVEKVDYATMTDAELKGYIAEKVGTSNAWARRALIAIYKYQTEEEQRAKETLNHNGVGFSSADAFILSAFAEKLIANPSYILSEKQLAIAFKRLPKYAGQLVRIVRNRQ